MAQRDLADVVVDYEAPTTTNNTTEAQPELGDTLHTLGAAVMSTNSAYYPGTYDPNTGVIASHDTTPRPIGPQLPAGHARDTSGGSSTGIVTHNIRSEKVHFPTTQHASFHGMPKTMDMLEKVATPSKSDVFEPKYLKYSVDAITELVDIEKVEVSERVKIGAEYKGTKIAFTLDLRERIIAADEHEGEMDITLGRHHVPARGAMMFRNGMEWGSKKLTLAPSVAALATNVSDKTAMEAQNRLSNMFGSSVSTTETGARARAHIVPIANMEQNLIRFLWRLGTMVWSTWLDKENGGTGIIMPPRARMSPVHLNDVTTWYNLISTQGSNTNYVFIGLGLYSGQQANTLNVLMAATETTGAMISTTGAPLPTACTAWPQIDHMRVIYTSAIGPVSPSYASLTHEDVWEAASMYATQHGCQAQLLEILEAQAALMSVPYINQEEPHYHIKRIGAYCNDAISIALPQARMYPSILCPMTAAYDAWESEPASPTMPKLKLLLLRGAYTNLAMAVALRAALVPTKHAAIYLKADSLKRQQLIKEVFYAVKGAPALTMAVSSILKYHGLNVDPGRILNTQAVPAASMVNIATWWFRDDAYAPQWDELFFLMAKLPAYCALFAEMRPLYVEPDKLRVQRWTKVGTLPSCRYAAEAMHSVIRLYGLTVEIGLRSWNPASNDLQVTRLVVTTSYRGVPSDWIFHDAVLVKGVEFCMVFRFTDFTGLLNGKLNALRINKLEWHQVAHRKWESDADLAEIDPLDRLPPSGGGALAPPAAPPPHNPFVGQPPPPAPPKQNVGPILPPPTNQSSQNLAATTNNHAPNPNDPLDIMGMADANATQWQPTHEEQMALTGGSVHMLMPDIDARGQLVGDLHVPQRTAAAFEMTARATKDVPDGQSFSIKGLARGAMRAMDATMTKSSRDAELRQIVAECDKDLAPMLISGLPAVQPALRAGMVTGLKILLEDANAHAHSVTAASSIMRTVAQLDTMAAALRVCPAVNLGELQDMMPEYSTENVRAAIKNVFPSFNEPKDIGTLITAGAPLVSLARDVVAANISTATPEARDAARKSIASAMDAAAIKTTTSMQKVAAKLWTTSPQVAAEAASGTNPNASAAMIAALQATRPKVQVPLLAKNAPTPSTMKVAPPTIIKPAPTRPTAPVVLPPNTNLNTIAGVGTNKDVKILTTPTTPGISVGAVLEQALATPIVTKSIVAKAFGELEPPFGMYPITENAIKELMNTDLLATAPEPANKMEPALKIPAEPLPLIETDIGLQKLTYDNVPSWAVVAGISDQHLADIPPIKDFTDALYAELNSAEMRVQSNPMALQAVFRVHPTLNEVFLPATLNNNNPWPWLTTVVPIMLDKQFVPADNYYTDAGGMVIPLELHQVWHAARIQIKAKWNSIMHPEIRTPDVHRPPTDNSVPSQVLRVWNDTVERMVDRLHTQFISGKLKPGSSNYPEVTPARCVNVAADRAAILLMTTVMGERAYPVDLNAAAPNGDDETTLWQADGKLVNDELPVIMPTSAISRHDKAYRGATKAQLAAWQHEYGHSIFARSQVEQKLRMDEAMNQAGHLARHWTDVRKEQCDKIIEVLSNVDEEHPAPTAAVDDAKLIIDYILVNKAAALRCIDTLGFHPPPNWPKGLKWLKPSTKICDEWMVKFTSEVQPKLPSQELIDHLVDLLVKAKNSLRRSSPIPPELKEKGADLHSLEVMHGIIPSSASRSKWIRKDSSKPKASKPEPVKPVKPVTNPSKKKNMPPADVTTESKLPMPSPTAKNLGTVPKSPLLETKETLSPSTGAGPTTGSSTHTLSSTTGTSSTDSHIPAPMPIETTPGPSDPNLRTEIDVTSSLDGLRRLEQSLGGAVPTTETYTVDVLTANFSGKEGASGN